MEKTNLSIGDAVRVLKQGGRVRRAGWNGKGMELFLVVPADEANAPQILLPDSCADLDDAPQDPFVMMKTASRSIIPWLCSQADLLATDWEDATEVATPSDQGGSV